MLLVTIDMSFLYSYYYFSYCAYAWVTMTMTIHKLGLEIFLLGSNPLSFITWLAFGSIEWFIITQDLGLG